MAKADGSDLRELAKIQRQVVNIFDDFGLQATELLLWRLLKAIKIMDLSISLLRSPIQGWHNAIGEKTIADAILDRIVHKSHRLELQGESMRKKKANPKQDFN